uniref:MARVEL domain-containing protein n=1 Tax=Timema shepardi TaxID=629360 RepID=A0A7R9AXF7_TIMSH|nr:unnamed protein product [Timema shepardi]
MLDAVNSFKNPRFLIKLLELVFAAVATALIASAYFYASPSKLQVIYGTIIGYVIIQCLVVTARLINQKMHKVLELMVSVSGAVMFVAAGAFLFEALSNKPNQSGLVIGAGIMSIFNGVVYLIDTFLIIKYDS